MTASTSTRELRVEGRGAHGARRERRTGVYAYLIPATVLIAGIFAVPIVQTILLSFKESRGLNAVPSWTGLANFTRIFGSPVFWQVTLQTVVWTVAVVAITTVISYVLAALLQDQFRGKRLFQVILMAPWTTSIALSAVMFVFAFQPDGLVNRTLHLVGLGGLATAWLANVPQSAVVLIGVGVWVSVPFTTFMLAAGMRSIPREVLEAAALESKSLVARHWFVTLPMVRTVLLIVTMSNFVAVFNSFPIIYVMTGGGPVNNTDILATLLYSEAFTHLDFGVAAALAVVILVILLVASLAYVHFLIHRTKAWQVGR